MTIELDSLMKALGFLLSAGSPILAWVIANAKATAEAAVARRYTDDQAARSSVRLDDIDKRLADKELRISKVEQDLSHIPGKDAVHRIELTIQKLQGDVEQANTQWRSLQQSIARIEEYLVHANAARPAPARSRAK